MPPVIDYDAHNEQVRKVWEAYHAGRPVRTPMILGISAQWTLTVPEANPSGITYQQYMTAPDAMLRHQLERAYWIRHYVPQDAEMGLPAEWHIYPDGQNIFEAGWLGGRVVIHDDGPPSAVPAVADERKWEIVEAGPPDPFAGEWAAWCWDRYEYFKQRCAEGLEFHGRPVVADPPFLGTDGPLTIAYQLRGAEQICVDMLLDANYFHALMNFIVEATIQRIKAYRRHVGLDETSTAWGFADDAVAMLSVESYREHVLPYHRRLFEVFGAEGPNSIHLCGDAAHLFPTIRDELKVNAFDTGYPIDFAAVRAALGPEVHIYGGPRVTLLRNGAPEEIAAEVKRIMDSGVREGGRFVLREANNVSPHTPLSNVEAMYAACLKHGHF
ncbi:MAG: hypothetical protein N2512_10865 [Armatimonadetes bacterium]|nr:hypothetical protein [Armatimonadota bacterium]